MKKVVGILSAAALALGIFLATNSVSPENNSELSLSSLTTLTSAEAACVSGVGQRPIYGYVNYVCGYEEDHETGEVYPRYCRKRVLIGYGNYSNNGTCVDGVNCWSSEGEDEDCYSRYN